MVFVGLSMLDENLRRLLHYSKQQRIRAYRASKYTEAQDFAVAKPGFEPPPEAGLQVRILLGSAGRVLEPVAERGDDRP